MKHLQLILLTLLTLTTGCSNRNEEQSVRYHDDGRAKPMVALVPIFDHSGEEFSWNLSDELTHSIYHRMIDRASFCLATLPEARKAMPNVNPFSPNIDWAKNSFEGYEFVVFAELVEHQIHPKTKKSGLMDKLTPSCELDMTVRLRVVDLRPAKPQIILQELLHQTNSIPKPSGANAKDPDQWKKKSYIVSPLGFSHLQLTKEVVKRIEDYVLIAKSKM